jgi:hypothetical protein
MKPTFVQKCLFASGRRIGFPAQISVESFRDIEVRINPQSPYDYVNMYHGPA